MEKVILGSEQAILVHFWVKQAILATVCQTLSVFLHLLNDFDTFCRTF